MPYCPKCSKEYGKDTEVCSDCGNKLIDDNEPKEKLLVSANEGFTADLIEGSLKNANIPYHRKSHSGPTGFSRYDTKYDSLGADFFVPQELLERAKEILPPINESNDGEVPENSDIEPEKYENPAPFKVGRRIMNALIFIILAVLVIFGVDFIMNIIRALLGYN